MTNKEKFLSLVEEEPFDIIKQIREFRERRERNKERDIELLTRLLNED